MVSRWLRECSGCRRSSPTRSDEDLPDELSDLVVDGIDSSAFFGLLSEPFSDPLVDGADSVSAFRLSLR